MEDPRSAKVMMNMVVGTGILNFTKIDQCLKLIISTMDNEEITNRVFISDLSAYSGQHSVTGNQSFVLVLSVCNIQPYSTALVFRPHYGSAASSSATVDLLTQNIIATVTKSLPETNIKFQLILNRCHPLRFRRG